MFSSVGVEIESNCGSSSNLLNEIILGSSFSLSFELALTLVNISFKIALSTWSFARSSKSQFRADFRAGTSVCLLSSSASKSTIVVVEHSVVLFSSSGVVSRISYTTASISPPFPAKSAASFASGTVGSICLRLVILSLKL